MKLILFMIATFIFGSNQIEIQVGSIRIDTVLLEKEESAIFLKLAKGTADVLSRMSSQKFTSNDARAFAVVQSLESHCNETQADIRNFLTLFGATFRTFWITNQIYIPKATPVLIAALLTEFPQEIIEIREERTFLLLPTFDVKEVDDISGITAATPQPGISDMKAPQMWDKGFQGQGINVCVLDTGCRDTHQDLKGKVKGQWDGITGNDKAVDLHGHGSHVSGTIAGSGGTGMAPKAGLYECKCCDVAGCPEAALIACGQYASCPRKADGCVNNPRVASCSWGGGSGDLWYSEITSCWETCNILPSFAAGNSGPDCNTLNSPGDNPNVICAGAIDSGHNCADFSSRGPSSLTDDKKPQVVAPGSNVVSCGHLSDTGYKTMSGTSMACPHISGMAALMLSQNPDLTVSQLKSALINSCQVNMVSKGATCGGIPDNTFPNNIYGNGKPDGGKAMTLISQMMATSHSESIKITIKETEEEDE